MVGRRGRFLVAEPLFERGAEQVGIGGGVRVRGSELVVVERYGARASVVAEIGDPGSARDVAAALIWERTAERGFALEIEDDAADAIAAAETIEPARRDLTALDTFTVDPASARDFDDAISASPDGDGIRIWVHIADVAAHVRPGTAARSRGRGAGEQHLRPGHGRADAAAGALGRRLQPRPGGRAARGHR